MNQFVRLLAVTPLLMVTVAANLQTPGEEYARQMAEYDRRMVERDRRVEQQQAKKDRHNELLYLALVVLGVFAVMYILYLIYSEVKARQRNKEYQEFVSHASKQEDEILELLRSIDEKLKGDEK